MFSTTPAEPTLCRFLALNLSLRLKVLELLASDAIDDVVDARFCCSGGFVADFVAVDSGVVGKIS